MLINGGYNYRVPTLNDRYWIPGGNTSLKPEDSKNVEVNLLADLTKEYSLNFSGGGFYRITDNWIQWTPAKSGVWSPVNIKTVSTSGLNLKFQLAAPISKVVKIYFRSGYTFTSAINKEVQLNSLSATEGKQLTYTPMHTAYGTISTSYNGWIISSTNYYSGRRFTTEENTLFLESYILHDLQLIRKFQFRRTGLQLHIRANNIWDQIYTLQPYMPTRGRWIQGGLTFTFKNKDYEKDN